MPKCMENRGPLRRICLIVFIQQLCIMVFYYFFIIRNGDTLATKKVPLQPPADTSNRTNAEQEQIFTSNFDGKSSINKTEQSKFHLRGPKLLTCAVDSSNLGPLDTADIVSRLTAWSPADDYYLMRQLTENGFRYGGHSRPTNCLPPEKIAIIVAYRDRLEHLEIFIRYMHPFLQQQQLEYDVFVIEQNDTLQFNRGTLMNIGFVEALNVDPSFDCFIFHDVDLLPEDSRNTYSCPKVGEPRQLAFSVDIFDYEPLVREYAGGVTAIRTIDFARINGYSNNFWGWGGEDTDLYRRFVHHNLTLVRMSDHDTALLQQTRYRTIYHRTAEANPGRFTVLEQTAGRMLTDGLVSLTYERKAVIRTLYYTHILVKLSK